MTLADLLASAEDTPDPRAYISRVKAVMASELEQLDRTAKIEDTHYFNHSAIPDFVVSWDGERAKREVFLRHSYESVDDADDERYLADADAMVVALRPAAEEAHDREVGPAAGSRLLVTDTAAVDVIGARESAHERPLTTLVQANFLRGARGHVGPIRAEQLLQMDEGSSPAGESAQTLIAESFAEDAAARITRTAELIALALDDEQHIAPSVGGQLSLAELRSLLPWLLRQEGARSNAAFWQYIGTLFTFEDFEGIRQELAGLDVSPLVRANASSWSAKRAYVGLVVPTEESGDSRPVGWSFENAALGVDIGSRRLYLAHRGTMLKKRPGSVSPAWERVQPTLDDRRIGSIDLKGIRRSVRVTAEQSPDVRADVEDVTQSLDDAYFVDRVTVRVDAAGNSDGLVDLEVRFDEGLVVADGGASLRDLSSAALEVLELGRELDPGVLESLLDDEVR